MSKEALTLEIVNQREDEVDFKVTKQLGRGEDFAEGGEFLADNGVQLASDMQPENSVGDLMAETLFVRGSSRDDDDTVMTATTEEWERIQEAVREYNYRYAGGPVGPTLEKVENLELVLEAALKELSAVREELELLKFKDAE